MSPLQTARLKLENQYSVSLKISNFPEPPTPLPPIKLEIFFFYNTFIQAQYAALECRKLHLDSCFRSEIIEGTPSPNLSDFFLSCSLSYVVLVRELVGL
jgi:hypothetical protein